MPVSQREYQQNESPEHPALPPVNPERNQSQRASDGNAAMPLVRQTVEDVAAVELPDRQQIERCGKQAEPRGAADGAEKKPLRRDVGMKEPGENTNERGNAK